MRGVEVVNNVKSFKGATPLGQPDPNVVAKLEELLDEAKSGMLRGILFGVTRGNNTLHQGWVHAEGEGHRMSTSLIRLNAMWAEAWGNNE